MKKIIIPLIGLMGLFLSGNIQAQNSGGGSLSASPCYDIAVQGACVCRTDGKLQNWLSVRLLKEAKTKLDQCIGKCQPMRQYQRMYYQAGSLGIEYLGGDWDKGQAFKILLRDGGNIVVILTEDIL